MRVNESAIYIGDLFRRHPIVRDLNLGNSDNPSLISSEILRNNRSGLMLLRFASDASLH